MRAHLGAILGDLGMILGDIEPLGATLGAILGDLGAILALCLALLHENPREKATAPPHVPHFS